MAGSYMQGRARYYNIIAGLALVTLAFHANVSHRFAQMMDSMSEATDLKRKIEGDQLELFDHYRRSEELRISSRRDMNQAYSIGRRAIELDRKMHEEIREAVHEHQEAKAMKQKAADDQNESAHLDTYGVRDTFAAVGDKFKGNLLAHTADEEATKAKQHLEHSAQMEKEGNELLAKAEAALKEDPIPEVDIPSDQGLCKWLPWACNSIKGNTAADPSHKATDQAVSAATQYDEAHEILANAKKERDQAMELFAKSAAAANESLAILEEAKELQEKSAREHANATKIYNKSQQEYKKAAAEEKDAEEEDAEVIADKQELQEMLSNMSDLVHRARKEANNATRFEWEMRKERIEMETFELRIRSITYDAKQHVSHAGWYALAACLFGTCLLLFVSIQIIETFRTEDPIKWIVREPPLTTRDLGYLCNHFLIFLLTLGFAGEILREYRKQGNFGRVEIVVLFSLVGAVFQVTLLHFTPNMVRLFSVSSLNANTFQTLLAENVGKSGLLLFLVFNIEMLLCWVNLRSSLFSTAYRLNVWWLWALVAIAALSQIALFEDYSRHSVVVEEQAQSSENAALPGRGDGGASQVTRLLSDPVPLMTDDSASFKTVSLETLRSASTGYGSAAGAQNLPVSAEIGATFISSWRGELNKVGLLVDFLIASWAIWVIRRDMVLIFKFSPISSGIVWNSFPLWILDVIFIAILGFAGCIVWQRRANRIIQRAYEAQRSVVHC